MLCRAGAEAPAWLAPLGSAPRAEALGSLLKACPRVMGRVRVT